MLCGYVWRQQYIFGVTTQDQLWSSGHIPGNKSNKTEETHQKCVRRSRQKRSWLYSCRSQSPAAPLAWSPGRWSPTADQQLETCLKKKNWSISLNLLSSLQNPPVALPMSQRRHHDELCDRCVWLSGSRPSFIQRSVTSHSSSFGSQGSRAVQFRVTLAPTSVHSLRASPSGSNCGAPEQRDSAGHRDTRVTGSNGAGSLQLTPI